MPDHHHHRAPTTHLGYLLHKHPDQLQSLDVSLVRRMSSTRGDAKRSTATLLLSRPNSDGPRPADQNSKHGRHSDGELAQYVNDRPYAASSMLAVAIKEAFRTALTGRCDARPELAAERIPLTIGFRPCAAAAANRSRTASSRRSAGASTPAASRCGRPGGATPRISTCG